MNLTSGLSRRTAQKLGTALAVTLLAPVCACAASGVGLNLGGFSYYSSDIAVVDQMHNASAWMTGCTPQSDPGCKDFAPGVGAGNTKELDKVKFSADGWPLALPSKDDATVKYRHLSLMLMTHNGRAHPAGTYVVTYEGKGRLEYGWSGRKVDALSRPGRDLVEVTLDRDNGVLLTLKETDPADPVRNVRFILPGGVCENQRLKTVKAAADCQRMGTGKYIPFELSLAQSPWNPDYLRDLVGFRALRFLDWGRANDTEQSSWRDRAAPTSFNWAGSSGVPFEAMFQLAAAAGADPWINIPYKADDDFARQFGKLARTALAPGRTLILEYSNEPWNAIFKASIWMRERAVAHWPAEAAKGTSPYTLQASWYALRAARICGLVKEAFGDQKQRVQCVANTQAANPWNSQQVLDCPYAEKELGQRCGTKFDALAIAPYFGNYINDLGVRTHVAQWYSEPDQGLGKLFEEILGESEQGLRVSPPLAGKAPNSIPGGSVALANRWTRDAIKVAASYKLPVYAYEGGQHLVTYGRDKDETYRKLVSRANKDPRMGKAYRRMLDEWKAAGGRVYMLFNHLGAQSAFGAWGLKETMTDDQAPKWQAALQYRDSVPCWWARCEE